MKIIEQVDDIRDYDPAVSSFGPNFTFCRY